MKQKKTKYTQINTNKSKNSETGDKPNQVFRVGRFGMGLGEERHSKYGDLLAYFDI